MPLIYEDTEIPTDTYKAGNRRKGRVMYARVALGTSMQTDTLTRRHIHVRHNGKRRDAQR